ncbi:hypothetical protein LJC45_05340, partial [Alistipes sp. OttesenSCG-928-B03]|nr:hypothetical protein [Alistipes sp. OttesenSCG-928-B03]
HSIDPLAERRLFSSPYGYCLGNPISNIDLHGLTDWKSVWKGVGQTIGGIAMVVTGGIYSGGTAGIGAAAGGAALIAGGMGTVALGVTKIVGGVTSDGSEASTQALESLPTSIPDIVGITIDVAMENENDEARNVVKVVEGVASLATSPSSGIKAIDAFSTLSSAAQVAEGATGLVNTKNGPSQKPASTKNKKSNDSRTNYVEIDDTNENEQNGMFWEFQIYNF